MSGTDETRITVLSVSLNEVSFKEILAKLVNGKDAEFLASEAGQEHSRLADIHARLAAQQFFQALDDAEELKVTPDNAEELTGMFFSAIILTSSSGNRFPPKALSPMALMFIAVEQEERPRIVSQLITGGVCAPSSAEPGIFINDFCQRISHALEIFPVAGKEWNPESPLTVAQRAVEDYAARWDGMKISSQQRIEMGWDLSPGALPTHARPTPQPAAGPV